MIRRVVISFLLSVVISGSCFAETFRVDSEDDLRSRISSALPGDRIVLAGGVYSMKNSLNVWRDGTQAKPITLTCESTAILDGSEIRDGNPAPLKFNGANHWVVENITCRRSNRAGISINESRFIEFVNSKSHSNNGSGFDAYRSPDLTFFLCAAWDNFDLATNGQNSDGFAIKAGSDRCKLIVCDTYENSDDGVDLWLSSKCELDDCWSFSNGLADGDGNGFKLGSPIGVSGRHVVKYCIAWKNVETGYDNNGALHPSRILNCVADRNSSGYVGFTSGLRIANCIDFRSTFGNFLGDQVDDSYNTWNLKIDNPRFVQTTDPSRADFYDLQRGSPCINAGVDVGLPFEGKSPNLGVK